LIKNIIFDFDGVILDSVPIKTEGFRKLFQNFSTNDINKLVLYHELNGGKSRYVKIKYFFNELLHKDISEQQILEYANKYSEITKEELTNPKYISEDTLSFIRENYKKYEMHIASGADEKDLKYICEKLDLTKYFLSINGSPKIKGEIVKSILLDNNYDTNETVLIGDSVNDFDSAEDNGIDFFAYNNQSLKSHYKYIDNLKYFQIH
jgi:phosphoglycolate phosphatase-like HAD superfamily hydrolase